MSHRNTPLLISKRGFKIGAFNLCDTVFFTPLSKAGVSDSFVFVRVSAQSSSEHLL